MNTKDLKPDNEKCAVEIEQVLSSILEKSTSFVRHLDQQINILIGISSGVFIFAVSGAQKEQVDLSLTVLALFSAATILVGLFAIHPPKFMRKRGQKESILYNKRIEQFDSPQKYFEALTTMLQRREAVTDEYSLEIYNIVKYYYRPKRKLFHVARNIFLIGIILGSLIFVVKLF